jgi:carbamoyltransferase
LEYIATEITSGKIIGWFQGRAEFGARALGNRSILADPQDPGMQDKINKCIKFRESFRPFAPSVTLEDAHKYFKNPSPTPYMNLTFAVTTDKLPAITHVDGTARVQTVAREENPLYYKLIKKVGEKSGIPVVLNTSLNIMEQPMVCAPREALTVFGATGMDILVLNNYVLAKGGCNF